MGSSYHERYPSSGTDCNTSLLSESLEETLLPEEDEDATILEGGWKINHFNFENRTTNKKVTEFQVILIVIY